MDAVSGVGMIILQIYVAVTKARAKRIGAVASAWNAGDVSPPGRSRRSDSRASQAFECMHTLGALAFTYYYLVCVAGWQAKVVRCGAGLQKWGLFRCVKPL